MNHLHSLLSCFHVPAVSDWKNNLEIQDNSSDLYRDALIEPPTLKHEPSTSVKNEACNYSEVRTFEYKEMFALKEVPAPKAKRDAPTARPKLRKRKAISTNSSQEPGDQRKKRLARKAEQARQNRKRKKERVDYLEAEAERLQQAIDEETARQARLRNCKCGEAAAKETADIVDQLVFDMFATEQKKLQDHVRSLSSSTQVEFKVRSFFSMLAKRQDLVAQHLSALQDYAELSPPARFLAWALNQDPDFYLESTGVWKKLFVGKLRMTQRQLAQLSSLQSLSFTMQKLQLELRDVLRGKQGQLKGRYHGDSLCLLETRCLQSLRSIMTAPQLIGFCVWACRNEFSIDALIQQHRRCCCKHQKDCHTSRGAVRG